MPSAKRSITIRRPVDEVFSYVADGTNAPKWRAGVVDIAHDSGDGVGAVYRQGVKGPFGRRIAADYEITALETNKRLAFKAIAGRVRPNGEFTFKSANDATTISFSLDAQLSGIRRLLMGRAVQRTMEAEMRALDKLKSNLERGGNGAGAGPHASRVAGSTAGSKRPAAARSSAKKPAASSRASKAASSKPATPSAKPK